MRPLTQCPPVLLGRGKEDPRYTATQYRADLEMLAGRYVAVEPYEVPGGHAWSVAAGREIGHFVTRLVTPSAASLMPDARNA